MITTNNYTYIGEVDENRKPHGIGKMTWSSWYVGEVWEGEFKNASFVKGKKTFPNGTIQEGEFVGGKLHGTGKIINPDGTVREEGKFENGILVEAAPKDIYDGPTNEYSQPHGKNGIMRYADGTVYEGGWRFGSWYGLGKYTVNDKVYEGSFLGTKKSASLTLTENGHITHGSMSDGEFIPFD